MNKELLLRYDKYFGQNSSLKLLNAQKNTLNNTFIRVNLSKTTTKLLETYLKKNRVKYSKTFLENAFRIEKSFFNLSSALESLTGEYYIQDLASQIPVNAINLSNLKLLNKKITILDMAASPGSKTTQLADHLLHHKIEYEITALEPDQNRLQRLINNIQKQKINNIKIYNELGQNFKTKEKYDIILLDAPCSGNLGDDRTWLSKRNLKGIEENSKLQRKLLENASRLLKDTGQLIYSTCSLEVEENELNMVYAQKVLNLKSHFCQIQFGFETDSQKLIKDKAMINQIKNLNSHRIMPYLSGTQGFFVCCLTK